MINDPLTLPFWSLVFYFLCSHACIDARCYRHGALDLTWTQPGPNPVHYSLLPVYEALLMGTVLFFLLLYLCTAFLSSLPPPAHGCPQNSQALNMPQANEYIRFHPSVCSVCTVCWSQAIHLAFNCLMLLILDGLCIIAVLCSLCLLTAAWWYWHSPARTVVLSRQGAWGLWAPGELQASGSSGRTSITCCRIHRSIFCVNSNKASFLLKD